MKLIRSILQALLKHAIDKIGSENDCALLKRAIDKIGSENDC